MKKSQTLNNSIKVRVHRVGAVFIDWYLSTALAAIPITFYFRQFLKVEGSDFLISSYSFENAIIIALLAIIIALLYYAFIPLFVFKGQTIGKKICKIKVVKVNGQDVDFKTVFIREILMVTILEGGIVVTSNYLRQLIQLFVNFPISTWLKYIAYAITLCSFIYAYFNSEGFTFHDKIAHTRVVKV